jgi:arginase family enzyme
LEEENDSSYVISVYMNHKKCFAFVELKTIELTSVCLDLDGIVYCSNILKIQRANEYKPELMVSMPRIPIHFNIKKAPFPNKAMSNSMMMDKKPPMHGMHDDHAHSHNPHEFNPHTTPSSRSSSSEGMEKKSFNFSSTFSSSIIRSCAIADIPRGALVLLGFPYDEGARRAGHITGAALGPRAVRQYLYQLLDGGEGGSMCNPEFGMDWSQQSCGMVICDVGDVPLGLLLEEALAKLGDNIADIIRRGGVPVVIGGSGDMSYANAAGLMTVAGGSIGILSVNSHLNVATPRNETKIQANTASRLLLSDTRFCPPREGLMSEPWCDGKFVHVAAQGTLCTPEEVRFVEDRGGKILWLSKDIRQVNPFSLPSPGSLMADESAEEGQIVKHGSSRPTTPALGSSGISVSSSSSSPFCPCCHSADRLQTLLLPVLSHLKGTSRKRPIYMSLHLESLHDTVLSGVSSRSYDGLSAQEATQVCLLAGADDNVAIFDICGLNPEVEDMKSPILVAQLTYAFIIGFLRRSVKCEDVGGSKSTPPPLPRGESDRS